ncbi:MAG: NAD(P)-dependent oxidoreductase [Gemmatimonadota bacterium]|nr:NAD(P)-dependent oxidoreductase [Gemmatimonadota bacterium]
MQKVAFLGLGAIGTPMAHHLAGAGDLAVWNRTREKADAFAREHKARAAASPADAARGASVVITCLPKSSDVESILAGDDGLLAGLDRGATLVDCTSGDPASSRRIAAMLANRGVDFMDAPVSGGVKGAEAAQLTVMCGGDRAVFDRVYPVLDIFGEKIVHCGAVGAGDALKAVNNALLAIHIWSAAEGLVTLVKSGVSPTLALDVINASSGRSNSSQNLIPERVLTRAFPRTFRLALLDKDIGIAAEVAREAGVPSPLFQITAELFRVARAALGEEADHVEAVKIVEQWAGAVIEG